MPGTAKKRTHSAAFPLSNLLISLYQFIVSFTEKMGSLTPWVMRSFPPWALKGDRSVELASMKSHADLAYAPDSAKIFGASLSKLKFRRYSTGAAPVAGTGTGGVVKTAEIAPLPRVALMLEFAEALYIPIFQIRQPGFEMPASQAQSAA